MILFISKYILTGEVKRKVKKGKVHLLEGSGGRVLLFLEHRSNVGVGSQSHAPASWSPIKNLIIHCTGGWVVPRDDMDSCGKIFPHGYSIPGPPSPLRLALLTTLFRPTYNWRLRRFIENHKEKEASIVHHFNFLMMRKKKPRLKLGH
jgi:hypothetical protein